MSTPATTTDTVSAASGSTTVSVPLVARPAWPSSSVAASRSPSLGVRAGGSFSAAMTISIVAPRGVPPSPSSSVQVSVREVTGSSALLCRRSWRNTCSTSARWAAAVKSMTRSRPSPPDRRPTARQPSPARTSTLLPCSRTGLPAPSADSGRPMRSCPATRPLMCRLPPPKSSLSGSSIDNAPSSSRPPAFRAFSPKALLAASTNVAGSLAGTTSIVVRAAALVAAPAMGPDSSSPASVSVATIWRVPAAGRSLSFT